MNETRDGVAVVFPGQGSQRPGMAASWRDQPSFERWAQADALLGRDVSHLGLDADEDELRIPVNCQIALFVHGVVIYETWSAMSPPAAVTAGHSLGEYNALVAGGVLDFADALTLVEARARATQDAADAQPGTMVACLGYPVEVVTEACDRVGAHLANDNAPGQIVVAGTQDVLGHLREVLEGTGERGKVVGLAVGAAYHSPHMRSAVEPFAAALDLAAFRDAEVPVVANVDARPHRSAADWPKVLRAQLTAPVRWRETTATLAELGARDVVELGASAVLTGLIKRTDRTLGRRTITRPDELGMALPAAGVEPGSAEALPADDVESGSAEALE